MEIVVDSSDALSRALKAAKAGDTIYLDSGTYSGVSLKNLMVSGDVTIASKDPGNPAVITDLTITNSSGFNFSNLELAAKEGGQFAFLVYGSKDLTFSNLNVHGSLNNNPQGDASGISIRSSSDIRIQDSEFHELKRGVGVTDSKNVEISGNSFHDLQTDGVMVADVQGLKITANNFKNFFPAAGDHPDAIQFMTSGTTEATQDVLISGNVITRGTGASVQGIFMGDEVGTLAYKNVVISDNLLIGTGYNGIAVGHGKNVTISGNELISYEGKTNQNWILIKDTDGLTATGNSAVKIAFDNVTNLHQGDNVLNSAVSDAGGGALAAWFGRAVVGPEVEGAINWPGAVQGSDFPYLSGLDHGWAIW